MRLKTGWWLGAVLLVYLVLAVSLNRTYLPWSDEAWFASPGFNLVQHGNFGTSVIDETATWGQRNLRGLNTRTYWIMPLHPLLAGAWSVVAGTSLFAVRLLSMLWGVVALIGWYTVARNLSGDARAGLFAAGLLAIDFQFLYSAGVARMDMMTEALIACSFAAFLALRERDLSKAVLASHALLACAAMTHPIMIGAFAGLVALTIYFDRARLGFRHVALAAAPYLVAGCAWGLYILRDRAMFWDQFHGNMSGRFSRPGGLMETIRAQIVERYLWIYGFAPDTRGFSHIKILLLLFYAGAIAVVLLTPAMRKRREFRALLIMIAVQTVVYSALDQNIQIFYLVHIIAPVIVVSGMALDWLLRERRAPVWAIAGLAAVVLFVQLSVTGARIRGDGYHKLYLITTTYLQQHAAPNELIMGSSELAYQLGWDGRVVDDYRLGYVSGKRPAWIVLDKNRYQEWIGLLKEYQPEAWRYDTALLARDFREVHRNDAYVVYQRVQR